METLHNMANALLEKETLNTDDIDAIMAGAEKEKQEEKPASEESDTQN